MSGQSDEELLASYERFLCQWGRVIFMDPDAEPCKSVATVGVLPIVGGSILHGKDDINLAAEVIKVCETHLAEIARPVKAPSLPSQASGTSRS